MLHCHYSYTVTMASGVVWLHCSNLLHVMIRSCGYVWNGTHCPSMACIHALNICKLFIRNILNFGAGCVVMPSCDCSYQLREETPALRSYTTVRIRPAI